MLQRSWLWIVAILELFAFVSAQTTTDCPTTFTCPSASPTSSVPQNQPTVFMIRHGEKDHADKKWDLNPTGRCRAMCVERLFGSLSQYNITKILVETPKCKQKHDGRKHQRPALTAANLARQLGLTMDMHCDETDHGCVAETVHGYTNQGNVLIVWEHNNLQCIAQRLQVGGSAAVPPYCSVFNKIWTVKYPFTELDTTYEQCTEIVNEEPSPTCDPNPAYLCPARDGDGDKVCVPVFGTTDCGDDNDDEVRREL